MSDSVMPSQDPAPAPQQKLFSVFLDAPPRRRWPLAAVLIGIALTVGGMRLVTGRTGVSVVTPRGIRTVEKGMTTYEVNDLLGRPFALADSRGGLDCYRYGYPNLDNPTFVVWSLCYEESRLRDISQQHYTAWIVSEDGSRIEQPTFGR